MQFSRLEPRGISGFTSPEVVPRYFTSLRTSGLPRTTSRKGRETRGVLIYHDLGLYLGVNPGKRSKRVLRCDISSNHPISTGNKMHSINEGPIAFFEGIDDADIGKALTHSSFKGATGGKGVDNTRFAFLGDAVINLLEAERLFHEKEELPKGLMTDHRQKLVSDDALSKLLKRILKSDYQIKSVENHASGVKAKATIVEALFGLLFEKKGIEPCRRLWKSMNEDS